MIDLEQLRRTIETAPAEGDVATVTRGFLQQVAREISEGRAAQALLAANQAIGGVVDRIAGAAA